MNMDLSLHMRQDLRLEQRLAPQIIQSIEILPLTALELQKRVEKELLENPLLEQQEEPPEGEETISTEEVEQQASDSDRGDAEYKAEFEAYYEDIRRRPSSALKDRKYEAMQNTAARSISLQEHLENQFKMLETTEQIREIGINIIYNIDSNGYVQYSIEEMLETLNRDRNTDLYTIKDGTKALDLIRLLDPRGVGGRDLTETLLLQVPVNGHYTFERYLIENHLGDIEKNKLPLIARISGESIERIKESIEFIRTLSPKPGAVFSTEASPYIMPDVVVEKIDGRWEVRLESTYIPRIRITPAYRDMLMSHKGNAKLTEYIRKKIDGAKWLMRAIEQRQSTLHRVAREIVDFQIGFLEHGVSRLKPLKMEDIADVVGVHVSTVGRAISGKYIQTPRGIYALKFFFNRGMKTEDGTSESTRYIKTRITAILKAEDKKHPLSDEDIVAKLKSLGVSIARRTITKYRKAMGIPSSRQRREY